MRVSFGYESKLKRPVPSSQFPVISSKQQVTNPKFYPLILSRHQGEILKSLFQVPSPTFQIPGTKGQWGIWKIIDA